jgi:hypothetical protein
MSVTLNLRPDVEAALVAQARTAGLSVEDYLQRVVEERVDRSQSQRRLTPPEWGRRFEEWADSFPHAPLVPDEALSREDLYPDRR